MNQLPPPELQPLYDWGRTHEFELLVLPQQYPDTDKWEAFQTGYRVDGRTGESLTSTTAGSWQPDWWVIATDYFGDAFVIDLREQAAGYPVSFLLKGAGNWEPVPVEDSVAEFHATLQYLAALESDPLQARQYVVDELPQNSYWAEVAQERERAAEQLED